MERAHDFRRHGESAPLTSPLTHTFLTDGRVGGHTVRAGTVVYGGKHARQPSQSSRRRPRRGSAAVPRRIAGLACLGALVVAVGTWWATWAFPAAALAAPDDVQVAHVPRSLQAVVAVAPQELQLPATAEHPAYTLYVPGGPPMPRTALVALHGMGGNGPGLASRLIKAAEERNWLLIAPTIPYGDWRDPNQLVAEELRLLPQMASLLDAVPVETGVPVVGRALLFGFSRGAQEALRFALLYPDRVDAVAGLSAGTYTLPMRAVKTVGGAVVPAPLPFGVADLEQRAGRGIDEIGLAGVEVWIGVGARDNVDGDVPRQWDQFVGKNRVERAQRFVEALSQLGWDAEVAVVPGAGHEITGPMVDLAMQFLAEAAAVSQLQVEAAGTLVPVPAPIAPPPALSTAPRGI